MSTEKWFKDLLESFEDDFDFRLEKIILNITEQICKKMKEKNINRSRLAEILNVSPAAVTKILNGNSNFTLRTLLSLSDALDSELTVQLRDNICEADSYNSTIREVASSSDPFPTRDKDAIPFISCDTTEDIILPPHVIAWQQDKA